MRATAVDQKLLSLTARVGQCGSQHSLPGNDTMSPEDGAAKARARNHGQIQCLFPRGPTSLITRPERLTDLHSLPANFRYLALQISHPVVPTSGAGAAGFAASRLGWGRGGNRATPSAVAAFASCVTAKGTGECQQEASGNRGVL